MFAEEGSTFSRTKHILFLMAPLLEALACSALPPASEQGEPAPRAFSENSSEIP